MWVLRLSKPTSCPPCTAAVLTHQFSWETATSEDTTFLRPPRRHMRESLHGAVHSGEPATVWIEDNKGCVAKVASVSRKSIVDVDAPPMQLEAVH